MQFVDNKGTDQTVHKRRLIWAFVVRFTESVDNVVYVDEQRMSRSVCIDVHAHLDLRCSVIV